MHAALNASASAPLDPTIDPSDTYVVAEIELRTVTSFSLSEPMLDPMTQTMMEELVIDDGGSRIRVEAGYSSSGQFVVTEYQLDPPVDPLTGLADENRITRGVGTTHSIHDASGALIPVTFPSGMPTDSPMSALGDGAVGLHGGALISDPEAVFTLGGAAQGASVDADVSGLAGRVDRLADGRIRIVSSGMELGLDLEATPSGVPAVTPRRETLARTYRPEQGRGGRDLFVLEEVYTEAELTGRGGVVRTQEWMTFRHVRWHENTERDAARAARVGGRGSKGRLAPQRPFVPPLGPDPEDWSADVGLESIEIVQPGEPGYGGGGGGTDPCAGRHRTNVLFQHGLNPLVITDASTTWGSPHNRNTTLGKLRSELCLGHTPTPSLPSLHSHRGQAQRLKQEVRSYGQGGYVVVGHSQGALVGRYAAQELRAEGAGHLIAGVISLGTPHEGALLAQYAKAEAQGGLHLLIQQGEHCRRQAFSVSCTLTTMIQQRLLNSVLDVVLDVTAPATQDLQPGSASSRYLNAQVETFPRFGIQHYPTKRWMPSRLVGDLAAGRPTDLWGGRNLVRVSTWAYRGLRVCQVGGWLFGGPHSTLARECGGAATSMDSVDRVWDRITAPGMPSDGVVQGPSQVYPRAILNVRPTRQDGGEDSHLGQTQSPGTQTVISRLLQQHFDTAPR